jgi:hypothetical protein
MVDYRAWCRHSRSVPSHAPAFIETISRYCKVYQVMYYSLYKAVVAQFIEPEELYRGPLPVF